MQDTIPIGRPGLYLTRNGRQVRVTKIDRETVGSLACEGFSYRTDSLGRVYSKWQLWQANGRFRFVGDSGMDIMSYVGE